MTNFRKYTYSPITDVRVFTIANPGPVVGHLHVVTNPNPNPAAPRHQISMITAAGSAVCLTPDQADDLAHHLTAAAAEVRGAAPTATPPGLEDFDTSDET